MTMTNTNGVSIVSATRISMIRTGIIIVGMPTTITGADPIVTSTRQNGSTTRRQSGRMIGAALTCRTAAE